MQLSTASRLRRFLDCGSTCSITTMRVVMNLLVAAVVICTLVNTCLAMSEIRVVLVKSVESSVATMSETATSFGTAWAFGWLGMRMPPLTSLLSPFLGPSSSSPSPSFVPSAGSDPPSPVAPLAGAIVQDNLPLQAIIYRTIRAAAMFAR